MQFQKLKRIKEKYIKNIFTSISTKNQEINFSLRPEKFSYLHDHRSVGAYNVGFN